MDEYIKREDALDAVLFALVGTGQQSRAISAIRDCSTADVVPRSEVDEIFEDIDRTLNTAIWVQELEIKTNRAIGFNADAERFALRKKATEDVKDYLQIVKKKYTEERK